VALQAERPNVSKIALAATFHYWHNVVGIPQAAPAPRPNAVFGECSQSGRAAKPPYVVKLRNAI
jgi:hypothetical protein